MLLLAEDSLAETGVELGGPQQTPRIWGVCHFGQWYRSSSVTDFDNSEIASPVLGGCRYFEFLSCHGAN